MSISYAAGRKEAEIKMEKLLDLDTIFNFFEVLYKENKVDENKAVYNLNDIYVILTNCFANCEPLEHQEGI